MARIDQLAATKASLELLILENRNLHDHFGKLMPSSRNSRPCPQRSVTRS